MKSTALKFKDDDDTGVDTLLEISQRLDEDSDSDIERALRLTNEMLGTTLAIISEVKGDIYTVRHFDAPPETLSHGQQFDLGQTYCAITLQANDVVAISDMENSSHSGHPCYQAFGLETYVGTPITIGGKVYGTLNFSDPSKRELPWTNQERSLVRLLGALVSQTLERRATQQKLGAATKALAQTNEQLQTFAYSISHDLREPLRSISGFADILSKSLADRLTEEEQTYLQFILDGSERLNLMAKGLLSYLKQGAYQENQAVDLNEIVRDVRADLRRLVTETATQIHCQELPQVNGNATQLRLVFQNLLTNAVRFRQPEVSPEINIEAKVNKEGIQIEVSDNGIGFNESLIPKMFRLFGRLHSRNDYPGTGLGLALVDRIMTAHNGEVRAASPREFGSCFTLIFPAQSQRAS